MSQNIELHFHPKKKRKTPKCTTMGQTSCAPAKRPRATAAAAEVLTPKKKKTKTKTHKTKQQQQQQQATTYPTVNATNNKKKTPAQSISKWNCSEFVRFLRSGRRGIRGARRKMRAVAQPQ
jgi:hypothetical protein